VANDPVGNSQFMVEILERLFAVQRSEMTSIGIDAAMK